MLWPGGHIDHKNTANIYGQTEWQSDYYNVINHNGEKRRKKKVWLYCVCVQETDLERMREQWLTILTKRQEYLDQHLQKIVSKPGTTETKAASGYVSDICFSIIYL